MEANRVASAEVTLKMHEEFSDLFTGIGYFKGTFSLQVKDDAKSYKLPPGNIGYVLQETFEKEIERLQEHQILTSLRVNKRAKWCKPYIIVLHHSTQFYNPILQLSLHPAKLNQYIRPKHRGLTLNDIHLKLTTVCYITIIDSMAYSISLMT